MWYISYSDKEWSEGPEYLFRDLIYELEQSRHADSCLQTKVKFTYNVCLVASVI